MGSENLKDIERIYQIAIETPRDKRSEYIEEACGDNVELRKEVESLLSFDQTSDELINQTPEQLAAEMFSEIRQTDFNGKEIGQYEVLSQIGKGGMGTVYLAKDKTLGRHVAIKFLDKEFSQNEDRLKRFILEAKTASALNHPNIITIYQIGEFEETKFIATEFIEGETLKEKIENEQLTLKENLEIAIQIVSALDPAHNAGIVHRDIKPDNIMIRPDGVVKILDFGIAKLSKRNERFNGNGEETNHTLTKPGMIIGTTNYMSPEQARGKGVDSRTDIFSFGVVLYLMFSGKLPFEGETPSDVVSSILKDKPKPLEEISKAFPLELKAIVEKAIEKDKAKRYQAASEILNDLKKFRKHLDISEEFKKSSNQNESTESQTGISVLITDENAGEKTDEQLTQTAIETGSFISKNGFSKGKFYSVGILLLALIGFGFWYFVGNNSDSIESIAVLPLVNEKGDESIEYLTDGITETLIKNLSEVPELSVKSRNSSFRYKGKELLLKKIGEELNVEAVLVGRAVQNDENVSISLELVDTKDETVLWSESYRSNSNNLLVLQKNITRSISDKLRPRLSNAEKAMIGNEYTNDTRAYEAYLKGRFHWVKREGDNLKKAVEFYEKAIEIDPGFALAWSGLADVYSVYDIYNPNISRDEMSIKAKAAARKAIEINPELGEAYASLGQILFQYDWKFAEAKKSYEKAIKYNPTYPLAYQWQAELLGAMGKFEEALESAKKAVELEPFSVRTNFRLGAKYLINERYEEAEKYLKKAEELDPGSFTVKLVMAEIYVETDRVDKAIEIFKKDIEVNGKSPYMIRRLASGYALKGQEEKARETLQELIEMTEPEKPTNWDLALVYARLGDREKLYEYLQKSYQKREGGIVFMNTHANLKSYRNETEFREILEKLGLAN